VVFTFAIADTNLLLRKLMNSSETLHRGIKYTQFYISLNINESHGADPFCTSDLVLSGS
jgi:hypothetical protein